MLNETTTARSVGYAGELKRLQSLAATQTANGVTTWLKDRTGHDQHTYEPLIWKTVAGLPENPQLNDDLVSLRQGTETSGQVDLTTHATKVTMRQIVAMNRRVRVVRIARADQLDAEHAILYFHGGAYYGGTPEDVTMALRYLAEQTRCVVYNVDYALAPEQPYPAGILDGLAVAAALKPQYRQLSVSGDSAGAAIALGVSQLCQSMGIGPIESHLLFYPTLIQGSDHAGELWDDRRIEIVPTQRPALHRFYQLFKQLDTVMTRYYLNGQDLNLTAPLLSPLLADPQLFKRTSILVGEFDPFRLQDEAMVNQLGLANGDVNYVRYGGLSHAFLNFTGNIPAVQDALEMAARFV
ncbi:alpha/beta hydrolase fold domain-containing protein [Levilactobacillus acidifarinae]|uniref:Esterase lipase n=1 Tax=Levilactobacillus acidifarinae DSM 19394 = JCM 15949 TaxID=1423715 RepID=A0A0R1LIV1_9LACO|nr:alpha/beta hydrolase fold domain-containing protein [Levilactobacillus acidifarinae]KRK95814.1 esterase lipase [Levilactobacillus acidifarinae DSM 19394]GEO69113.1 esterase [Levilactobacillus acidifarinae]